METKRTCAWSSSPPSALTLHLHVYFTPLRDGTCTIFSMMSVWDSEITTKFLTLEREQINYSAQNPGKIDFSMPTEVWKKTGFQYFLIGSWDSVWEQDEMAEKPDCCQAPVQNVTEDISVHPNMLFQLCRKLCHKRCSRSNVEQESVPLLICICGSAQVFIICLVNHNLTQ